MITGLERKINIMKLGKGGGQEQSKQAAWGKLKCFLNWNENWKEILVFSSTTE